jgi:heme A synthase
MIELHESAKPEIMTVRGRAIKLAFKVLIQAESAGFVAGRDASFTCATWGLRVMGGLAWV